MPTVARGPSLDLYYEVRGDASLPPLVLLNGMSQSTANWMTQSRHLSEHYRVINFDARGQGRTPAGDQPLRLDVHVQDVVALLRHLSLERAHLCGFSFGARIALAVAARHPERVDKLVLTSAGAGDSALRRLIVRSWYEVLQRGGVEAMSWCALPHILGEGFLQRHEAQIPGMIRASRQRNSKEGLEALLVAYKDFPEPLEDAARVRAPTLLLSADSDPLVSPQATESLRQALSDAEHTLINGCGHTIPIEEPDRWRTLVHEFLSKGGAEPI